MVISFPRKGMHQLFSTQLLSPNASNKVIKFLKQQGKGGNAPRLSLCFKIFITLFDALGDKSCVLNR